MKCDPEFNCDGRVSRRLDEAIELECSMRPHSVSHRVFALEALHFVLFLDRPKRHSVGVVVYLRSRASTFKEGC